MPEGSRHHDRVLDAHHLAWADEIVDDLYLRAGANPERPPSPRWLATKLLGTAPRSFPIQNEGELFFLNGLWAITTRKGLPLPRVPSVIGHELTHWWFRVFGERPASLALEEALCDAVGARLAAPKVPFKSAVDAFGHRVHALAKTFRTTQTVALLRVAEISGRPALVDRPRGRIARGGAFEWPDDLRSVPRSRAHLIRVDDYWGMMAAG